MHKKGEWAKCAIEKNKKRAGKGVKKKSDVAKGKKIPVFAMGERSKMLYLIMNGKK